MPHIITILNPLRSFLPSAKQSFVIKTWDIYGVSVYEANNVCIYYGVYVFVWMSFDDKVLYRVGFKHLICLLVVDFKTEQKMYRVAIYDLETILWI